LPGIPLGRRAFNLNRLFRAKFERVENWSRESPFQPEFSIRLLDELEGYSNQTEAVRISCSPRWLGAVGVIAIPIAHVDAKGSQLRENGALALVHLSKAPRTYYMSAVQHPQEKHLYVPQ